MIRFSLSSDFKPDVLLAVVVFQGENRLLWSERAARFPAEALRTAREDGFQGKPGGSFLVRPPQGRPARRLLLLSAGKKEEADIHLLRRLAATAADRANDAGLDQMAILVPDDLAAPEQEVQALAEGVLLGSYRFDRHKGMGRKENSLRTVHLAAPGHSIKALSAAVERGRIFGESANFARDLINEPPSLKTPATLGRIAQKLASGRLKARVFGKDQIRRMRMQALLGVNRGSAHPPVFVHLHYRPAGKTRKRVALVGKGITFDSGGLSLKTADGMMTMKYDMAGAAVVFAVLRALAELKPEVEVHGLAPITENMPGHDAYKPGDVVRAANGKTIEVLNTDAEGRVVLADALSYASRLPVDEIIDMATLTGAVSIALGRAYAGLMSNSDNLADRIKEASKKSGEKVWPLPLEPTYREHIHSKVADLKNIGNPGEAGTIIGGLFLQEFVDGKPWAHLDIASCGWAKGGSQPGATGVMVRTILHYLLSL